MNNKENTHTVHFFKGRRTTKRIMTLRNTTFDYAISLAFWVLVAFLWHDKNYWMIDNEKKNLLWRLCISFSWIRSWIRSKMSTDFICKIMLILNKCSGKLQYKILMTFVDNCTTKNMPVYEWNLRTIYSDHWYNFMHHFVQICPQSCRQNLISFLFYNCRQKCLILCKLEMACTILSFSYKIDNPFLSYNCGQKSSILCMAISIHNAVQ